jgi:hypothetical protein
MNKNYRRMMLQAQDTQAAIVSVRHVMRLAKFGGLDLESCIVFVGVLSSALNTIQNLQSGATDRQIEAAAEALEIVASEVICGYHMGKVSKYDKERAEAAFDAAEFALEMM